MAKRTSNNPNPVKVGFWQSGFPNQLGNLSLVVFLFLVFQLAMTLLAEVNIFDPDDFRSTDDRIPALGARIVVDEAGVLTSSEVDDLTKQIDDYEKASGGQMEVLIVESLHGDAIEDFSLAVAEKWKIGSKDQDNGVLLVLAIEDHRSRLEIGYGLEGVINDARAGDILRGMEPALRAQRYAAAISGAIREVSRMVLAENAPEAPDSLRYDPESEDELEPAELPDQPFGPSDLWAVVFFGGIGIIAVCMITAVVMIHPSVKKSIGLVVMIVVIRVLFQILLAALRSSGRSGGSGGGGGRSRSGGGGSFGGGGASGRW